MSPHLQNHILVPLGANIPPFPQFDVHLQSMAPPRQMKTTFDGMIIRLRSSMSIPDPSEVHVGGLYDVEGGR
jgi:hypothetical protein